jgi:hypothetical protein
MTAPFEPVQGQDFWVDLNTRESLFPDVGDDLESSDLIVELHSKLEELEDLCGRLSFSMREISQVLKIKPSNSY